MIPAVGKSGPCTNFRISASCELGLFTSVMVASTISVRLCGGIFVAMPTAMPSEPLTSKFGMRAKNVRLDFAAIVVGVEVDGFLVEIFQQWNRNLCQLGFGITIG